MTAAVIDPDALRHLGAVIHKVRPQWDPPGITAALELALTSHGYPVVAETAVRSARDPGASTPAVIVHRCRNGWNGPDALDKPSTPTPQKTTDMRCPRGHWIVAGENHVCEPIGDPKAGAAAARQALAAARAHPTKETAT